MNKDYSYIINKAEEAVELLPLSPLHIKDDKDLDMQLQKAEAILRIMRQWIRETDFPEDMPVYFDGIHLMSLDLYLLHRVARYAGLKREWFQEHAIHPHYDVTSDRIREKLRQIGVKFVTSRELVGIYTQQGANGRNGR